MVGARRCCRLIHGVFAIPGGDRGPVVLDFATAMIAGGWLYAAQSADALLPSGSIIDAQGKPSRNPEDYFRGWHLTFYMLVLANVSKAL